MHSQNNSGNFHYRAFHSLIKLIFIALISCCILPASSKMLIDSFESGTINSNWKHIDSGGSPQTKSKVTSSTSCNGYYSLRSKAIYPPDYRTELYFKGAPFGELKNGEEYWLGIAIKLADGWKQDGKLGETLFQFHHRPDVDLGEVRGGSSPLALRTKNGKWLIRVQTKSPKVCKDCNVLVLHQYLGGYKANAWTEFVFNVKFTHKGSGFLKVWKDDKLVVKYSGPIGYNDVRGPFIKMGIYKSIWKSGKSIIKSRTVYHDDFRIKKGSGTRGEVAPKCGKRNNNLMPPDMLKILQ